MTVIGEVRKNPRRVTKAEATTRRKWGRRPALRRPRGGKGEGNQHVSVGESGASSEREGDMKQGVGGRMRTRPPTTHRRQTRGRRRGRARAPMLSFGRRRMTQVESSERGRRGQGRARAQAGGKGALSCLLSARVALIGPPPAGGGRRSFCRSTALSCGLFPDSIMCRSPPPPPPPPPLSLPPDRPPKGSSLLPTSGGRASDR